MPGDGIMPVVGGVKRLVQRLARSNGLIVAKTQAVHSAIEGMNLAHFFEYYGVDLVIDIGAHTGEYRSTLRDRAGFRGRIVSCEPHPDLAAKLNKVAADDPLWTIEPVAVGEAPGSATSHRAANTHFSSIAVPTFADTDRYSQEVQATRDVEVEVATVEHLIRKHARPSDAGAIYVKVDVQGLERSVVLGARGAFNDIAGFQLELSFRRLYESSWLAADAIPEMESLGFGLTAMFPNTPPPFPELVEMDAIFRNLAIPLKLESDTGAKGLKRVEQFGKTPEAVLL